MYEIDVFKENVMIGNDALFKCQIPSFVSDLVSVESWTDSEGIEIRMNSVLGKNQTRMSIGLITEGLLPLPVSSCFYCIELMTKSGNINLTFPVLQIS